MTKFQESLKKYLDTFLSQEMYFVNDTRNLEFFKKNSKNATLEEISLKLSVMDDADFVKLGANEVVAKHILALNIDPKLAKGDLSVVEEIANVTVNGKKEHLLHFASAYCNLHRPDIYPIYSDQHLEFYKRYFIEYKLNLNPDEFNHYPVFTRALNDLVERYGLKGKLNYLQMRKFGWLYAEKVLQEADPLTV